MNKPYLDTPSPERPNTWIREFNPECDSSEFVWHRDKKNRTVEILSGDGWVFQMDENIPVELKPGDVLTIPRYIFHRIFKAGKDLLKIQIYETE